MAEVVVSRCFGGFGLSPTAQRWLYANHDAHQKIESREKHFSNTRERDSSRAEQDRHISFCELATLGDDILLDEHDDSANRACPLLVKAVKTLGAEVNGRYAKLEVVTIPDGIKWVIDDYDGSESVEEEHRKW